MRQTILGRKLGMTQVFDRQGNAIPVTIVQAGPCTVLQIKTDESDGYNAIQLGFLDKKEKHTTKPLQGHFKKADATPKRHIREARVDDPGMFTKGQVITAGMFEKDDFVDITGASKGKGFAGVMKRHGFAGFMATHGVHESKRGPGSIGQSADPAKVFKGMRMPGHMGNETVTIQNLRIVDVRESQNLIMVKGPVPGGQNSLLIIRHAAKKDAPPLRQAEPEETVTDTIPAESDIEEDAMVEEGGAAESVPAEAEAAQTEDDMPAAEESDEAKASPEPEEDEVSEEAEAAPEEKAQVKEGEDAVPEPEETTAAEPEPDTEPDPAEEADDESKEK